MPGIVADYIVVHTGPVRLRVGADTDRTFQVPLPGTEDVTVVKPLPMIVSYFLLLSVNNLHMTIDIDGITVSDRQYTNGPERCIQQIAVNIPADPLRKAMTFRVLRGEALFSDVVLWFQRDARADEGLVSGPF
jgi:hypothetical protein